VRGEEQLTLPKAVDDALEELMARDRDWFDANPDRRIRRRLAEGCELRSNALAAIAAGVWPGPDPLEVLVVRAPESTGIRIRMFLPSERGQQRARERDAAYLAAAETQDEFYDLLRDYLRLFGSDFDGSMT
jgi:hypothetical protein